MPDVPAKRPCGSCPYRLDVPSGVWHPSEYEKLPRYDLPTAEQPFGAFLCHQQDGRLCAGWVAVHDMTQSLGLRICASNGDLTPEQYEQVLDYTTDVPLHPSGLTAAVHGLRDADQVTPAASRVIAKVRRRQEASCPNSQPPPPVC